MQKRILLAVTGGIAAYKSCELVRLLKKEGHEVTVALSKAASEFVSAQTFEALSGNPVLTENNGSMAHINATRAADLMLIAPASANTIAKLAHGFADNGGNYAHKQRQQMPGIGGNALRHGNDKPNQQR